MGWHAHRRWDGTTGIRSVVTSPRASSSTQRPSLSHRDYATLAITTFVLDDCWSDGRDSAGYLRADEQRFPHGMKWMANHIHDLNMLFGMYSSAGEFTCARYEGSLDHETYDAESWASWDVDYLKYDNCYHRGRFGYPEVSFNRYNVMAEALNATGRNICTHFARGARITFTPGVSCVPST